MSKNSYDMVEDREFVDLPGLSESWEETLFQMEQRYPKGIMLHASTKAEANALRRLALDAAKDYCYSAITTVRQGDGDWLVYIAQL